VKAHVTLAVVDDHQQPKSPQPVGKNHSARVDRLDRCTGGGTDENAVPLDAVTVRLRAELPEQFTTNGPGKFSAHFREAMLAAVRRRDVGDGALDLLDQLF